MLRQSRINGTVLLTGTVPGLPLVSKRTMAVEYGSKDRGGLSKKTCVSQSYSFMDCKMQLMIDFPIIYSYTVSSILEFHNGQYAKAYKSLTFVMNDILQKYPDFGTKQKSKTPCLVRVALKNDNGDSAIFNVPTMTNARPRVTRTSVPLRLKQEMALVKEQMKITDEEADRRFAMNLLEEDYQEKGQLIECACCFGNCVFDNMAQCVEGHLVCVECLNAFTKETVYGAGKIALGCMASDCTAFYPEGELKRCLSVATWSKLEERALKQNLNMAEVEDLVTCPYCDFAAILSPRAKVFHCFRDDCQKDTCRDCRTDWTKHVGLPCSAIEKRDETALRKKFEEKMTKAKVRTCVTCKAQFTKESGCNKMTCRCGTTMCYICRTPQITYEHFCKHPRDPGKDCSLCRACSLWTDPEADEERAITEIKKEAQAKRKELGFDSEKEIGIPSTSKESKKKIRLNQAQR